MKFEKIMPGMTLYDVRRRKMGNTTISTVYVQRITVVSVDAERRRVGYYINRGGRILHAYGSEIKRLRETEPMLVSNGLGHRLGTREEIKAAKTKS